MRFDKRLTRVLAFSMVIAVGGLSSACTGVTDPDAGPDDAGSGDAGVVDAGPDYVCNIDAGESPDFAHALGCPDDFDALSSSPLVAAIPGARSIKTVIDRSDDDTLYFQNSERYKIHWEFTRAHLSGNGKPLVPELAQFNSTEYYSPQRRFLLGAITYYEGADVYAYEIAPYDTASAEMIRTAFDLIRENVFFGGELLFHPTSRSVETTIAPIADEIPIITTDELFAGIRYQPLNLASSIGRLRFIRADDLEDQYLSFRDIVVLDRVPNDISVVLGIITQEFQTPLSHINVLSQNRGTPNMGLREAFSDEELRALEGKWVRLTVGEQDYSVEEVTIAEADLWWEDNRPATVQVPERDITVEGLWDIEDIVTVDGAELEEAIDAAIPAFGGKASHYAALAGVDFAGLYPDKPDHVVVPKAFSVPIRYYVEHLEAAGLDVVLEEMLADPLFIDDPAYRDSQLGLFRAQIRSAPVDPVFSALLFEKIANEFGNARMRFRSSTNAEDLDGFTGAGLYWSESGDPLNPAEPVLDAVKRVWSSVWFFRAFEERSFRGIDHAQVGMALLVHRAFNDEDANGVAFTANPYDTTGLEPGFYVNVQVGENSVVRPDPGTITDQFIYQYDLPGQPILFLGHSNLVPEGETVLTTTETYYLGAGLKRVHDYFRPAYGPPPDDPFAWYAMDVEFKFAVAPGDTVSRVVIKQARPAPSRGE
jgi:pyruvate,water dikinase